MKKNWWLVCGALMRPAFVSTLALAAGTSLLACSDDNDPKTWVKRLEDPAQRAGSLKRMTERFESLLGNHNKDRDAAEVKAYRDVITAPLTEQYVAGNFDEKSARDAIRLLADLRDERAFPAYAKAFNDFEAGKNDDHAKFVAQAIAAMAKANPITDTTLIDALWNCFAKFRPSKVNSIELVRGLSDAVLAVKSPTWGPKAVEKLAVAVKNPRDREEGLDQIQFAQATSVRLISELKYTEAAGPLVKVLLSPTKADLRPVVNAALMRMPTAAEPLLIAALDGSNPEFAAMGKDFGPDQTHLAVLADSIGYLSRPKGKDALVTALANASNDPLRTVLAQSLIRFPTDETVEGAFIAAYKKIAPNTLVPLLGNIDGRAALAQSSAYFFDPANTKWLLKEIDEAKGDLAVDVKLYALEAAIKLTPVELAAEVEASTKKNANARYTEMFGFAKKALDACKSDAACYVAQLDQPVVTIPDTATYTQIKAIWMAAAYGNEQTRDALLAKLPSVRQSAMRMATIEAINHLTPKGDAAIADKIDAVVAADAATGSKELAAANDALTKVACAIRGRALP